MLGVIDHAHGDHIDRGDREQAIFAGNGRLALPNKMLTYLETNSMLTSNVRGTKRATRTHFY